MEQVWFITGVTSGTGLSLVQNLLSNKIKVAGTSRDLNKLNALDISRDSNFLGLLISDLANERLVQNAIDKTIQHFGNITHVVNNAGYGLIGAVEECSLEETKKLFDVLYFGPVNVIKAVLPHFRLRNEGYIFNVSSTAGFRGVTRFGHYCAVKFAITGMTESLVYDVKPFNIKVSNIIIGYFKTGFRDTIATAKNPIPEYDISAFLKQRNDLLNGMQPGDPNKFAEILLEYSTKSELPINLFIGTPAMFESCEQKVQQLSDQISSQKERNSKAAIN